MAETEEEFNIDLDTSSVVNAVIDAKNAQRNIRSNWDVVSDISSDVLGGMQSTMESKRIDKENKRKELQAYEDQFSENISKITEMEGGLGEGSFSLATAEAKKLQEEYMQAVQSGNKELQTKIEMRLQGLATGVGSLKESISIAAELKNNEQLSAGRTEEEKYISTICTDEKNLQYKDGKWVWKNPKFVEGGDQPEFFTQEDLDNSLGQIEEATFQ